ncbi:hypothetical protein [Nostoc sp.]|uniref:hypothetical protein n=1 Tax=Nostoc sp. TaxID=1180 RepID=UPI002FF7B1C7
MNPPLNSINECLILNNTLRVPFPTGRQGRTGSKLRVASRREARRRHRTLTKTYQLANAPIHEKNAHQL